MIKNILLAILFMGLLANISYADVKYTQKTTNDIGFEIPTNNDIPPDTQQLMKKSLPGSMSTTVTYIKGNRQRVDYPEQNTSTITMCDKNQIIELNHKNKTFAITDLNELIKFKQAVCKIPPENYTMEDPNNKFVIKIIVKDTGKTEMINGYKAKKYIRYTSVAGNPECLANTRTIEKVWVADLGIEDLQCPLLKPYQSCQLPPNPAPCLKNARVIKEGAVEIPGLAVRSQTKVMVPDETTSEFGDPSIDGATDDDPDVQNILFAQENYSENKKTGGQLSFNTEVTSISKDPLPDNLFEIPSDYSQSADLPTYDL